jgi:hypothetical protein
MNGKLSKLLTYVSIVIFSILLVLYLFTNNYIALALSLLIAIFLSSRKINHFGIVLLIISFLIRLVFILVANFPQVYDFKTLLEASHMFARGDYSFNTWYHFSTWGYQTAFVIYQGVLLKLFHSEFILKLLNIIYSSLLVYIVYKLGLNISKNEKSARIVSLLYMIFPLYLFLNSVLLNSHLATLLSYFGIFFILKNEPKYKDYFIGGLLIALGNIIRPEGIIIVLAILLYKLITLRKDILKKVIISLMIFLSTYFIVCKGSSLLVKVTNVNPIGLENKDPLWKFLLGFNYESCGYYVDSDTEFQVDRETEIKEIKRRALEDIPRTGKLMACKVDKFWLSSGLDDEMGSFNDKKINILGIDIKFNNLKNIAISLNKGINVLILALMLLGLFVNRKNINKEALFLIIMILITFGVFLFIEIQPRYMYFIHISLFALSTLGIKYIQDLFLKLKKK